MLFSDRSNDELAKKISHIKKGGCPNFFLSGISLPEIEEQAQFISSQLEELDLISFNGIVRHFSVTMPFFDDDKGAAAFVDHLADSESIASDCYGKYRGTIMIECSPDWAKMKYGSRLGLLTDYIAKRPQDCFILLAPVKKDPHEADSFFAGFASVGIWLRTFKSPPDAEKCVLAFCSMAQEQGYTVTNEAAQALTCKLLSRSESELDNISAAAHLLRQIIFDREISERTDRAIDVDDVEGIFVINKLGPMIGFNQ